MTSAPETTGAFGFLTAARLLRDLLVRRATGQLVATRGEIVKKIFFKNGFILFATSNLPADRLGDVLLARGMITRDQYEESASQVLATGRKQGTVLVQISALTPKDLFRGLIAQVRAVALSLFTWDDGSWSFIEGLQSQEEMVSLRLQTSGLLFEGLALTSADPRWADVWSPELLDLRVAAEPSFSIEGLDVPDAARRLFSLLDQKQPLSEMARLIDSEEREATVLLYGLTLLGLVDTRPRPEAQAPSSVAQPAPPAQEPVPEAEAEAQPAPVAQEPVPEAQESSPSGDDGEAGALREKVTTLSNRLETLSHYALLGVAPAADTETIKLAYIALAKEYHPDRFFHREFEDLQESVNTIFMRINEAYSTIHNPVSRAEYDREVLRLASSLDRGKSPPDQSHLAREQFTKGISLLNTGDFWSAIQALRWAVNISPQEPRFHTWLGVALMRTKKRLHEAEEHCKTAIALDYNNAQYYLHLGQVYRTGHLFEKAKKQFETALRLDPKHPGALKELRELEKAKSTKTL